MSDTDADTDETKNDAIPTRACFVCQQIFKAWFRHHLDGGVEFHGSPGYGSRFDASLLCEESLSIFVCDRCLAAPAAKVVLVHQPRPIAQDPDFRPWDPSYHCQAPAQSKDEE